MATIVKNKAGACVAQSHDLRAMLRGASLYGGVRKIDVMRARFGVPSGAPSHIDGGAIVTVHYLNGFTAETNFVSHSHAVEWAFERSELPGRVSFFAGCEVFAPGADLDEFTRAYIVAALWSSTFSSESDEHADEPLDREYSADDIGPAWRAQAIADCRAFQHENRKTLAAAYPLYLAKMGNEYEPEARAGHDFWLTRNRHGAGFWDRGIGKVGEILTQAAQSCGEVHIDEFDMLDAEQESKAAETPKEWTTYRTACGRGRAEYHAEWSQAQPWATYIDGSAGQHFADLADVAQYFAGRKMTLNTEPKE